jgi:hypothetical protein
VVVAAAGLVVEGPELVAGSGVVVDRVVVLWDAD